MNYNKKFLWIHIPKCAGSTLRQHPDLKNASVENFTGFAYTHTPYSEIESHQTKNLFKFSFCRNPYERIASAFFSFKRDLNFKLYDSFDDFILHNFKDTKGNISLEFSKTNARTCSYVRRSVTDGSLQFNDFFKTQSYFLKDKKGDINFNFIGKVENFDKDYAKLINIINIKNIKIKPMNQNLDKDKEYIKYFDGPNKKEKIEIVNELYHEDFVNFGYEKI